MCVRGETAAIDICGTGWSLTRLFEAAGQPDTEMVLVNRVVNPKLAKGYQGLGPTERPPRVKFMTEGGYNIPLEALNTADHRMVADVVEVDGLFVPTFVDLDASPRYDQLVRFSTRAFDLALAATDKIGADQLFAWFSTVRPAHVDQIYRTMGVTEAATAELTEQQTAENLPIRDLLAARREAHMKPPPKG